MLSKPLNRPRGGNGRGDLWKLISKSAEQQVAQAARAGSCPRTGRLQQCVVSALNENKSNTLGGTRTSRDCGQTISMEPGSEIIWSEIQLACAKADEAVPRLQDLRPAFLTNLSSQAYSNQA